MAKYNENELSENISRELDDSLDALDANTLSKIRQVRARAVDKAKTSRTNWSINQPGLLFGGLATVCVMVLAVVLLINAPTSIQVVPVDDIELISSSDNLELFEDLEFYEWLEEDGLQS